ncbi:MAG: peptidoglycan-binding protein [Acidobacteriota bacterium]
MKTLQLGLNEAGHPQEPDGLFGSNTERALKAFQLSQGLLDNGIVGKATWSALDPAIQRAVDSEQTAISEHLPTFDGDLLWVHLQEGHAGRPYWPEGKSGVTLDPGVDLGHAEPDLLEQLLSDHYGPLLSAEQRAAIDAVIGIKGDNAKAALAADPILKSIRISRDQANKVFPVASRPYWNGISQRFPPLVDLDTPASVQTVLLSLAYNRGIHNHHLESLGPLLEAQDWVELANKIGDMQQRHKQKGIRIRRQHEAALIRAELACLQA